MSALPLQRIEGKYEILEKLREGGMGAIYKVRHRLLDEIRVIKLMRPQLVEQEELKARFAREARLAIKLRHPNVAQIYDFTVDDDGTAFIIMEFIEGVTLEDMLSFHGPPPLGFTLEIAQQSLRALGYLHTRGFIHRDISPDNLMLTTDPEGLPQVKLIDLGIAKILGTGGESHLTQTGTFLGKIRYAPPEQFGDDGASVVDIRGDLYSFGVVLYELLTGRFPIQGRDPSSLIAGHLFRPPLPFDETDPQGRLPEGLRQVVLKALAKSPDERFATAPDLTRALAEFRTPDDIAAEDLPRLLTRPFIRMGAASLADPGSTQERLDQHFNLVPTPSPGRILEVVRPQEPEPEPVEESRPPSPSEAVRIVERTVELHLKQGDLSAAEGELSRALDNYGEQPKLRTLQDHLQELKLREMTLQVQALVQQARNLYDAEDPEAAFDHLLKARGLALQDPEIKDLLDQTEREFRRREEERARSREVAAAASAVEAALERQDDRSAEELLREATDRLGPHESFSVLSTSLEELRSRQARAAERRRKERISGTVAEIEALLAKRELRQADEVLRAALAEHGNEADLIALQARLEEMHRAARARPAIESTQRLVPVVEREEQVEPPVPKPQEIVPQTPLPLPVQEIASPQPRTPRWGLWMAGALAVIALLVIGRLVWFRPEPAAPAVARAPQQAQEPVTVPEATPMPSPVPPPALTPEPAPVQMGTLVIDALPWAEVMSIEDSEGKPVAVGPNRYTPMALSVPAGQYSVVLKGPGSSGEQRVSAVVAGSQGESRNAFAVFRRLNAEGYFRDLGF